jgi:diphosphomevalonate decarboxylase
MSIFKNVKGTTGWRSPSNIALVKYWGKYGVQMPENPSVSFTLKNAYTDTFITYSSKTVAGKGIEMSFMFEGKPQAAFEAKIRTFLESIILHFPFLEQLKLEISSENSFPHSTGIASSASSMSALALCLCQIESDLYGGMRPHEFWEKASLIARLGSGSACRSVFPVAAVWGKTASVPFSSQEFAVGIEKDIDPVFAGFKDAILIVSSQEKSVSSRAGHGLMKGNPYATARYTQANDHLGEIVDAMKNGDLKKWGSIVEKEALTLHALMMASEPPFILMRPETLHIIEKVQAKRAATGWHMYFTLDAGPNVHLLYPESIAAEVETFIGESLLEHCEQGKVIYDQVGKGSVKLQ